MKVWVSNCGVVGIVFRFGFGVGLRAVPEAPLSVT